MRWWRKKTFAVAGALAFILALTPVRLPVSASTSSDGGETLILQQQHCWYTKVTVYLNKQALLVQLPSRKMELYAQAPDWTVVCKNLSRREYSSTAYQTWITHGPPVSVSRASRLLPSWISIKTGNQTYKGLPATRVDFPRIYRNGKPAPLSAGSEGYALVYQGKESSEQAEKVLDALLERWSTPGIQLMLFKVRPMTTSFYMSKEVNDSHQILTTLSWARTKNKPSMDLNGYKLTKKENQIWYSDQEKEMLEDFVQ